ncbi:MAG: hypothetical protein Q7P63_02120 [Verrucomicrobiota bacterium JB022]|nr:hypothetical protein [Verrucomicrobiota bacterium JB022]
MHLPSCCRWFSLLALATAAPPAWAMTFEVVEIPIIRSELPDVGWIRYPENQLKAISADSSIMYGIAYTNMQAEPGKLFSITAGGEVTIYEVPVYDILAISGDGKTLIFNSTDEREYLIWTASTGAVDLKEHLGVTQGESLGTSFSMNEDGTVITGSEVTVPYRSFYWSAEAGMKIFEDEIELAAVSADGKTAVGTRYTRQNTESPEGDYGMITSRQAFRWTEENGFEAIPFMPTEEDPEAGYRTKSSATGVSPDGRTVHGFGSFGPPTPWGTSTAFVWKGEGIPTPLENYLDAPQTKGAYGAAGGGVVMIHAEDSPFIIDAEKGKRYISELVEESGFDAEDLTLEEITGISRDGSTIIGRGSTFKESTLETTHIGWIIRDYPVPVVQPAIEMVPLDEDTICLIWSPQPGVRHVLQVHNPDGTWTDLATHDASSTEIGPYTYEVAVEDAARYYRVVATKL